MQVATNVTMCKGYSRAKRRLKNMKKVSAVTRLKNSSLYLYDIMNPLKTKKKSTHSQPFFINIVNLASTISFRNMSE
jgi:hypothetical protein